MAPIWVGFWAQISLSKGPLFGRFCLNMDGLSSNKRKSSPKLVAFRQSEYDGKLEKLT